MAPDGWVGAVTGYYGGGNDSDEYHELHPSIFGGWEKDEAVMEYSGHLAHTFEKPSGAGGGSGYREDYVSAPSFVFNTPTTSGGGSPGPDFDTGVIRQFLRETVVDERYLTGRGVGLSYEVMSVVVCPRLSLVLLVVRLGMTGVRFKFQN